MSFFVPQGESDDIFNYKQAMWRNLNDMQFQLAYHANYTYADTEDMASFEIKYHYDALLRQKKYEKDEYEKAANKSSGKTALM